MRKSAARSRIPRWVAVATLSAMQLGCEAPRGVSRVVDPLAEVAMAMNRSGSRDRTWSYRHENAEPNWIVAGPAGTKPRELDTIAFPDHWRSAAKACLEDGEAVVILAEATKSACIQPVIVPELREIRSVDKRSGEATVFTLQKTTGNPWLVSVE